jgi:hypothetical protein
MEFDQKYPFQPMPTDPQANPGETCGKCGARLTPEKHAVAQRAYGNYIKHGSQPGHDLENWVEAEAELQVLHHCS